MDKLDITEPLVRKTIAEVEADVARLTGWNLSLDSLGVRVLSKDRGYEDIALARIRGAGVPVDEHRPRNVIEKLVEYVIESNVLAAYEPSSGTILVIGENVDESNMDGLRMVVAHELVHRGQHLHHPELFERMDAAIRDVFRLLISPGTRVRDLIAEVKKVEPIMALLESHAFFVQGMLNAERYPEARIEAHFSLPAILMHVFGRRKLTQYTKQLPAVAKAAEAGTLDDLYREASAGL